MRIQYLRLLGLALMFAVSACEVSGFATVGQKEAFEKIQNEKILMPLVKESFEREFIVTPTVDEAALMGWRGFIWDYGIPVIGTSNSARNVAAVIMNSDLMGDASNGERALYMYGRDGASTHSIYLFTHSFDLTKFSSVEVEFDYLTIGLNDSGESHDEYLKVDICHNEANVCGVGTTIDNSKLNGAAWTTIFESDSKEFSGALNGKNHLASDWKKAKIRLNIREFENRDTFTFRINAFMSDGFEGNDLNRSVKDLAAVDNIVVNAVRWSEDEGGDNDGNGQGSSNGGSTGGTGSGNTGGSDGEDYFDIDL